MQHFTHALLVFFRTMGGPGLLLLGVLDSSFLFAPLGNDLLVVALTAHYHSIARMFYYAVMSSAGSALGCLLVDFAVRGAGERGLERHLPKSRIAYLKGKVAGDAIWALIIASIAPPPFPFTAFVMAAAALQYPRKKLLWVIAAARMARFTGIGALALCFGRSILRWANSPSVEYALLGLIAFCAAGSVISVVGWIKRSRMPVPEPAHG